MIREAIAVPEIWLGEQKECLPSVSIDAKDSLFSDYT